MKIDCISDLHGHLPMLKGGDLLIVAGDMTACDRINQWLDFFDWFKKQQYSKKILVAGNHDGLLTQCCTTKELIDLQLGDEYKEDYDYLCDSGCEFEGLKIWGTPWTPEFCNWHFMKKRGKEIKEKWDLIPDDTDILVTHGPAYGCLDNVKLSSRSLRDKKAGCEDLLNAIKRVKPKLHVFGHIHEQGGQMMIYKHEETNTIMVNASMLDENYYLRNDPVRIEL